MRELNFFKENLLGLVPFNSKEGIAANSDGMAESPQYPQVSPADSLASAVLNKVTVGLLGSGGASTEDHLKASDGFNSLQNSKSYMNSESEKSAFNPSDALR